MSITYRCYLDGAPENGFQARGGGSAFDPDPFTVVIPAGGLMQADAHPLNAIQNPNANPDLTALHAPLHGIPIDLLDDTQIILPSWFALDLSGAEIHVFFSRLRLQVQLTDGASVFPKSRCGVLVRDFVVDGGSDRTGVFYGPPYETRGSQWTDPTGVATMICYLGEAVKLAGASVYTLTVNASDAFFRIRGAGNWGDALDYHVDSDLGIDYDPATFVPATGLWPVPVQGSPYVANPTPIVVPPGHPYPTTPKGYKQSVDVRIRDSAGAPIVGATVTLSAGGGGPSYSGVTVSETVPGETAPTGRAVIRAIPNGSTLWGDLGAVQPGASWFDFPLQSASGYPASAPSGSSLTPPRLVDPDWGRLDYPLYYQSITTDTLTGTSGPPTGPPPTFPAPGYTGGEWASLPYMMKITQGTTTLIDNVPVYVFEEQVTDYIREGFEPVPTDVTGPLVLDIDRLGNAWTTRVKDHQVVVNRRLSAWATPAQAPWQTFPVGAVGAEPWIHLDETSPEMKVNVVFRWGADTLYQVTSPSNGTGGWTLVTIGAGKHPFNRKDKATGITHYLYWRDDKVWLKRSATDGTSFLGPEVEVLSSAVEATYTLDFRLDPAHTIEMPYSDGTDIKSRISVDNGLTWSDAP